MNYYFGFQPPNLMTRVVNLEDRYEYYEIFQSISSDTGTLTIPDEAEILFDRYTEGTDALAVLLDGQGRPIDEVARESDDTPIVVSSLNANGDYVLSGVAASYPIGFVYQVRIKAKYTSNISLNQITNQINLVDSDEVENISSLIGVTLTDVLNNLRKITTVNSALYTMQTSDSTICVDYTATGAVSLNLPPASDCYDAINNVGLTFNIKDSGANATEFNITINSDGDDEIIDIDAGQSSTVINGNGGSLTIQAKSLTEWIII